MGKAPTKDSTDGESNSFKYAASSMKGSPAEMEDAHKIILQLNGTSESFFGVYDGHGGAEVASYCSRQFHIELRKHSDYLNNLPAAMKDACSRIDEKLKQSDDWRTKAYPPGIRKLIRHLSIGVCAVKWPWKTPYLGPLQEGSTACVTVVRDNQIIVGNIGDTRCVLSMRGRGQGQVGQIIDLSTDHQPQDEDEEKRIITAGGKVYKDEFPNAALTDLGIYRIDGKLHISRAIGDFQFKQNKTLGDSQQMVTCSPHICVVKITDSIDFLLTASSGIWSVKTSQEAVDFVRESFQSAKSLRVICEELLDECLKLGSKENLTVILVQFKSDRHGGSQSKPDPEIKEQSPPPATRPATRTVTLSETDEDEHKASHGDDPEDTKNETDEGKDKAVIDPGNQNTNKKSPPKRVACFGIQCKAPVSNKGSKGCFNMKGVDGFKGCFQGWLNHEKEATTASGNQHAKGHKRSDPPPPAESPKASVSPPSVES